MDQKQVLFASRKKSDIVAVRLCANYLDYVFNANFHIIYVHIQSLMKTLVQEDYN